MSEKPSKPGNVTSDVEVTNFSAHDFWLYFWPGAIFLCILLSPAWVFAGSVRGTVVAGGPSGGWVKIRTPMRVELRSQVAEARFVEVRDGEFAFEDVPEGGGYEVWAYPPRGLRSYPVQNLCVTAGTLDVEVRLEIAATIERICVPCRSPLTGRVLGSDGKPAKRLPVVLRVGGKDVAHARTMRNGEFRFPEAPDYEDVTIEVVREGLPLYRSTFHHDRPPHGGDRVFTLPDCTLPVSQPAVSDADERAVTVAALESYFNLMHGGTGVAFPENRRHVLFHRETISPSREQLRVRVASPANRDAAGAYSRIAGEGLLERLMNRSSRPRKVQFAPDGFASTEAERGACGPEYDEARFTDAVAVSRAVFHGRDGALIYLEHSGGARAYHATLTDGAWKIDWFVELWACC